MNIYCPHGTECWANRPLDSSYVQLSACLSTSSILAPHLETTQPEKHEDGKRREPKERRNGCLSQPASCLPTFKTTIENIFLFSSTEGKGLEKMFCVHHSLKCLHSQFPSGFFEKEKSNCDCGLPCCISTTKRKRCGNKKSSYLERRRASCELRIQSRRKGKRWGCSVSFPFSNHCFVLFSCM